MRKREIHSVAHWAMMFLLLMFPLLIVGISSFNKGVQREVVGIQTSISYTSIVGNEYQMNWIDDTVGETNNTTAIIPYSSITLDVPSNSVAFRYEDNKRIRFFDTSNTIVYELLNITTFNYVANSTITLQQQPWFNRQLVVKTFVEVDDKTFVNQWVDEFLNLPVNAWYKSLMNTVGVGFTNSSVMNVIYVMPVYILWVFIFDVIVDCFLIIIKLPHKLLNRLSGGENE